MTNHVQADAVTPQEANGLAIAGFVIALVGLLTGGILSPIGLIISLVALGRPGGRGFATAGIVIGLLGSCGLIAVAMVVILGLGVGVIAMFMGVGFVLAQNPEHIEFTVESVIIAAAIEAQRDRTGELPADLGTLSLDRDTLTDPWGNPYRYVLTDEAPNFDIVSSGADGVPDTDDDLAMSRLDELWQGLGGVEIVRAEGDDDGEVILRFGDKRVTFSQAPENGSLRVDTGDRVFELESDENGGTIRSREVDGTNAGSTSEHSGQESGRSGDTGEDSEDASSGTGSGGSGASGGSGGSGASGASGGGSGG